MLCTQTKPVCFRSTGVDEDRPTDEPFTVVHIDFLYRDNGTLWSKKYGHDALLFGTQEITVVKFSQIKRMRVRRLPQTQRLRHAITIADNGEIPRLTSNGKFRLPASVFRHFTANSNLHIQCFIVAEPRIVTTMPVIRRFNLFAIDK